VSSPYFGVRGEYAIRPQIFYSSSFEMFSSNLSPFGAVAIVSVVIAGAFVVSYA